MKKVFNSFSEITHLWAHKTQETARVKNGYFERGVIYSYGSHFPVAAHIVGKDGSAAVLFNDDRYSNTTAKHQREVLNALPSAFNVLKIDSSEVMKDIVQVLRWYGEAAAGEDKARLLEIVARESAARIQRLIDSYNYFLRGAAKKKLPTIEREKAAKVYEIERYVKLCDFMGAKLDAKTKKAVKAFIGGDIEKMRATALKVQAAKEKAAEKERKKRAAENAEKAKEALARWYAGQELSYADKEYIAQTGIVRLRVEGLEVATTKGARFPVDDALRVWPMLQKIVASGKTWQAKGLNGIKLGNYAIDSISAAGVIKAGCHLLEWPEVQKLAKNMGLAS